MYCMIARKAPQHRISSRHSVTLPTSLACYTQILSRLQAIRSASAPHPRFRVTNLFLRPRIRHSGLPVISRNTSTAPTSFQTVFSVWHSRASRLSMLLLYSRPLPLRVLYLTIPSGSTSPRKAQSCTLAALMKTFTRMTLSMYRSPTRYGWPRGPVDSMLISIRCRATGRSISMVYITRDGKFPVPRIRSLTLALP
jgi:hypothetical protein